MLRSSRFGIDVIMADGSHVPAGSLLRQAHERGDENFGLFPEDLSRRIESILRIYGVTSAAHIVIVLSKRSICKGQDLET